MLQRRDAPRRVFRGLRADGEEHEERLARLGLAPAAAFHPEADDVDFFHEVEEVVDVDDVDEVVDVDDVDDVSDMEE